jgi:cytochrome c-type biogenesis protein CcmH
MAVRIIVFCLLVAPVAFAAIDVYELGDPAKEQRFRSLIEELRCPKCQNQNIADSNAPLSADLRQKVYEMVRDGHSDEEIVGYLVARYGDFITYRPPLKPATWLLWFGPFAIIGMVLLGLGVWVRRRARQPQSELSAEERHRLATLLNDAGEEQR